MSAAPTIASAKRESKVSSSISTGALRREDLEALRRTLEETVRFFVINLPGEVTVEQLRPFNWVRPDRWMLLHRFEAGASRRSGAIHFICPRRWGLTLVVDCDPRAIEGFAPTLKRFPALRFLFTCSEPARNMHSTGCYRLLAQGLRDHRIEAPVWIRKHPGEHARLPLRAVFYDTARQARTILVIGSSRPASSPGGCSAMESEISSVSRPNYLCGARRRDRPSNAPRRSPTTSSRVRAPGLPRLSSSPAPPVAAPLFDLQSTTQRIREKTDHLKGVTIAVMGCIVNGPGEMADCRLWLRRGRSRKSKSVCRQGLCRSPHPGGASRRCPHRTDQTRGQVDRSTSRYRRIGTSGRPEESDWFSPVRTASEGR